MELYKMLNQDHKRQKKKRVQDKNKNKQQIENSNNYGRY